MAINRNLKTNLKNFKANKPYLIFLDIFRPIIDFFIKKKNSSSGEGNRVIFNIGSIPNPLVRN